MEEIQEHDKLALEMAQELGLIEKRTKSASDFVDDDMDPTKLHILAGLQDKNVFQGTYKGSKTKRRAKNKVARKSRRQNR